MCKNRKTPGVVADGADAEYICMDESQLIVISEKIEDQYAAIVEPMAICAHALERCPVENEDTRTNWLNRCADGETIRSF